jgi:MFS family permease
MDLCRRRGRTETPLWVGVISCLLNVAPSMLILLAPNLTTVWVAYGLSTFFCTAGAQISSRIMLANVTPSHLIGKIGALYYLTANLLGQAFGVSCIALVAQYGFSGPRALPHAMICCYLAAMAATLLSMSWAARSVRLWAASGGPEQVHPHTGRGPKAAATT